MDETDEATDELQWEVLPCEACGLELGRCRPGSTAGRPAALGSGLLCQPCARVRRLLPAQELLDRLGLLDVHEDDQLVHLEELVLEHEALGPVRTRAHDASRLGRPLTDEEDRACRTLIGALLTGEDRRAVLETRALARRRAGGDR